MVGVHVWVCGWGVCVGGGVGTMTWVCVWIGVGTVWSGNCVEWIYTGMGVE